MGATATDVIGGKATWSAEAGDNLPWLQALPAGAFSLVLTSPPYEAARTYSVGFSLKGQDWVDWLAPRVVEMCRVTDGLVCVNMAGQLKKGSYSPVVEWLVADLTRQHSIVCGPAPYAYFRFSIPGSGGEHYHRRDWEPVYCFCRPECLPLKWSDNTACGHPPKWAPGGEMSNRMSDGTRVNQWGASVDADGKASKGGRRNAHGEMRGREVTPSHRVIEPASGDQPALPGCEVPPPAAVNPLLAGGGHEYQLDLGIGRDPDGSPVKRRSKPENAGKRRTITRERDGQHSQESTAYDPPVLANPGNVVREHYDAEQVRQLLDGLLTQKIDPGDVIRCLVGGGQMGHPLAHENEAPFPERLAEFFVLSYAPPGSVVCDPFAGSGTTLAVAVRHGRRAVGCDLRPAQVAVASKRIAGETPTLFDTLS